MATTIQVDLDLLNQLKKRKMYDRESYADVIRDLIEDSREINEKTRKEIQNAREEIKAGKYYNLDEVRKQLNL